MSSSLLNNKVFRGVEKAVVADECTNICTADAIQELREQLAGGGSMQVNRDDTIRNPAALATESTIDRNDGYKWVDKATVATENTCTADSIRTLREQLAGGGTTYVDNQGSVYTEQNKDRETTFGKGRKFNPIEKTVVADENTCTADMVSALREQLNSKNHISVMSDYCVANIKVLEDILTEAKKIQNSSIPRDLISISVSTAQAHQSINFTDKNINEHTSSDTSNQEIMDLIQSGLSENSGNMLMDNGTSVRLQGQACGTQRVSDRNNGTTKVTSRFRELLAEGQSIGVNPDGRAHGLATNSASNLNNEKPWSDVGSTIVTDEWYRLNPALAEAEIRAMHDLVPDAKMGFLPDGRMYWVVRLHPVVIGKRKDWTLLAVYNSNHPCMEWGGSCRFYPVKPNISEMQEMVNRSNVTPKHIPHLISDKDNQLFICTQDIKNIHAGRNKRELLTTAAVRLRVAMRWITVFELGLIDQNTWDLFQQHGEI